MSFSYTLNDILDLFARYNTNFWPLQIVAYVLGIAVIILAIRNTSYSNRVISGILAFFWLWNGIVFNWLYGSKYSPAAFAAVVLFVIEGLLLIVVGVFRNNLSFKMKADYYGIVGGLFVLYGMVGYPVIEYLLGRGYPQTAPFGLVSCPMTVFTLGLLLWSERAWSKYLLIIPFISSLSALIPISKGVVEDIGLMAAGLITVILILYRDRAKGRAMIRGGVSPR